MLEQEEVVEGFTTSCRSCVFAEVNTTFPHTTQTGCQLGRLQKFLQQDRACMDSGAPGFYMINTICNACRGEEWKEANSGSNLIATVQREVQISMDIVLYDVNSTEKISWQLEQTLNACVKQRQIKPKKIIVVIKSDVINYKDIYNILQDITEPHDVPFQLVRVIEEDADIGRCVEMGIDKCSSQFVAVFDLGHNIPSNFIVKFNTIINDQLHRIIMVEPTYEYGGLVLSRKIFKMLGKNYNFPIFEKVAEVAKEQENTHLVFTWDTLWSHE